MIRLTLPWSVLCSVNQRTNPIAGRQYLTKRYRAALQNASTLVMGQVRGKRPKYPEGRVGVHFDFHPPDARRRDVGNFVKLPEDAMTGIVYADDSQIVRTTIQEKPIDREEPRVVITVRGDG